MGEVEENVKKGKLPNLNDTCAEKGEAESPQASPVKTKDTKKEAAGPPQPKIPEEEELKEKKPKHPFLVSNGRGL